MSQSTTVIHSDPDILGGTPVFVGTRVPLKNLLDYLEGGETLDEFLADFPSVTREQATAALAAEPREDIASAPAKSKPQALILPVVSLAAEHLVIGNLMRRNVLAYKAAPNNAGYDLICIHPDPRVASKPVRVQVKSRYQTDSDRAFPIKAKTFDAFDYVVIVFLNIGYFYGKKKMSREGARPPEFYTLPNRFVRENHSVYESGFERVKTKHLDMTEYRDDLGFEQIAQALGVAYPSRESEVDDANPN